MNLRLATGKIVLKDIVVDLLSQFCFYKKKHKKNCKPTQLLHTSYAFNTCSALACELSTRIASVVFFFALPLSRTFSCASRTPFAVQCVPACGRSSCSPCEHICILFTCLYVAQFTARTHTHPAGPSCIQFMQRKCSRGKDQVCTWKHSKHTRSARTHFAWRTRALQNGDDCCDTGGPHVYNAHATHSH